MSPTITPFQSPQRVSHLKEVTDLHKWREIPCSWTGRQHSTDASFSKVMNVQYNSYQNISNIICEHKHHFKLYVKEKKLE